MALTSEQRRQLLQANLPQSRQVRETLQKYLDRTGLTADDFARRINYSPVSLRMFVGGTYEKIASNDSALRAAILSFIEQHPIDLPDGVSGRLHETENTKLLRSYFEEALDRGRAYYVEGAPGTQKSYVLQCLVAELNRTEIAKNGSGRRAYYIYCPSKISRLGLLKLVAQAAGSPSSADCQRIIRNLRFDMAKRRALLIFDEAQHLDIECLESVRELYDRPPHFGLLFAGSHQLERMFTVNALALEQWNSRLHAGKRLPGISEEEAVQIILAEIPGLKMPKVNGILQYAYAESLGTDGKQRYISARRLFGMIGELKEKLNDSSPAAQKHNQPSQAKGATA